MGRLENIVKGRKMLKISGPRLEPWGTPHNNSDQSLKDTLTFALCHLLCKLT